MAAKTANWLAAALLILSGMTGGGVRAAEDAMEFLRERDAARSAGISLYYRETPLEAVFRDLERRRPGLRLRVKAATPVEERELLATPVSVGPLHGVSWDIALNYIADALNLRVDRSQLADGVIHLDKAARFTAVFDGVCLGEAIREIARRGRANVVFSAQVKTDERVYLTFADVSWRDVLASVLKAHGCVIQDDADGRILRIATAEEADNRVETRSRPLRYVRPAGPAIAVEAAEADGGEFVERTLLDVLDQAKSPDGTVTYESRTNTLILRDTAGKVGEMLEIIDQIDRPPQQILLETRLVTLPDSACFPLNVEWNAGGAETGYALGRLAGEELAALLRAAARDGSARIVQAPQFLALDNEEASVFIGSVRTLAPSAAVPAGEAELRAGVRLRVIPRVCRGTDRVILDLAPQLTDHPVVYSPIAGGQTCTGVSATMDMRAVRTKMLLRSGETGVISGLFRDLLVEETRRPGGLGKIPGVGKLLEHTATAAIRSNSLILVTPVVIPAEALDEAGDDMASFRRALAARLP